MALSKGYAGQAHLKHIAVFDDGRVGGKPDPDIKTTSLKPLHLADFSEVAQMGFHLFLKEAVEIWEISPPESSEADVADYIVKAIECKTIEEVKLEPKKIT